MILLSFVIFFVGIFLSRCFFFIYFEINVFYFIQVWFVYAFVGVKLQKKITKKNFTSVCYALLLCFCSSSNHKVEFIFTMKGVNLILLSCLVFTKTLTSNLGEFDIHWLNYFFNDCNYETVINAKTNSFYVRLLSYMYKAFDNFRFPGKLYDF